jgi:hypothetical protein
MDWPYFVGNRAALNILGILRLAFCYWKIFVRCHDK